MAKEKSHKKKYGALLGGAVGGVASHYATKHAIPNLKRAIRSKAHIAKRAQLKEMLAHFKRPGGTVKGVIAGAAIGAGVQAIRNWRARRRARAASEQQVKRV